MVVATALLVVALTATVSCTDDGADGTGSASTSTASTSTAADGKIVVTALSTDPSRVTGGDVLVGVEGTQDDATFTLDGGAVTAEPRATNDGRRSYLVTGIPDGNHTLEVAAGGETHTLDITSHLISGPVFSGEHLPMPTCTTENYGLGAPTGPDCFAAPKLETKYFASDRKLKELPDPTAVPADAYLSSVPGDGEGKPILVDVETGVINRGIYTVMTPHGFAWNNRLVYRFGGGCGTSFSQGFDLMGDPDPDVVARGYAIATNTLNTFQVSCNDVVSAETAMMVKEHVIETHGVPDVTIGEGGSGGAIQQFLIAQNYPGILDAIAPILPFPDAVSISGGVLDCALLNTYYRSTTTTWTEEQRTAVNGHLTTRTCDFWEQTFAPAVNPSTCGFGDAVAGVTAALPGLGAAAFPRPPDDQIYDAATNPDGLRCTLQDGSVNIYGRDPATGFARRAWDNVGVQYGLTALNDGIISVDQFLDLNEAIGSYDIDGHVQPARSEADLESLETSYRTGRVMAGGGDLRRIPIIAVNLYTDPLGDIHDRYRVFTIRERLAGADGEAPPNLAVWTRGLPPGRSLIDSLTGAISLGPDVIGALDEWATALADAGAQDDPAQPVAEDVLERRLVDTRPDDAVDTCFEADGTVIASGDDVYDGPGPCTDPYPVKGDPRTVAGARIREDTIKCTTVPVADAIDGGVYETTFDEAQRARLDAIFPAGVCDWSQRGVGRVDLDEPWQSY